MLGGIIAVGIFFWFAFFAYEKERGKVDTLRKTPFLLSKKYKIPLEEIENPRFLDKDEFDEFLDFSDKIKLFKE